MMTYLQDVHPVALVALLAGMLSTIVIIGMALVERMMQREFRRDPEPGSYAQRAASGEFPVLRTLSQDWKQAVELPPSERPGRHRHANLMEETQLLRVEDPDAGREEGAGRNPWPS